MREKGWSREFDDPIDLPRGRPLVTLEDAGNYITELPKADFRKHFREEWLPNRAIEYFRRRDGEAVQFLPKLIAANTSKKLH